MFELLKVLHVLGWSGWFGLSIAEAVTGVQARKAPDAATRKALSDVWLRIGGLSFRLMAVAVVWGLATFFYEGAARPGGMGEFMKDPQMVYIHIMLTLGLVAAALSLVAKQKRTQAGAAGDDASFLAAYKKAAMFSGMSTLCILLTILEVYLRTAI
jgi:hypothetical protein